MSNEAKRRAYHHGDLFEAVLDEVERMVELGGLETVSLRAIAKAVGVSHCAVFRHFSDKRDVLTAFAIRSARRMADTVKQKVAKSTPSKRFLVAGLSYVDFARRNPGAFRVIFREDVIDPTNPDYLLAMDELGTVLAIGGHGGDNDLAVAPKALLAWASVHGLATLCVDGSLSRDVSEGALEGLIKKTLSQLAPILSPRT